MTRARALLGLVALGLGPGCPNPCTGAGCADEFPGAMVAVFRGGQALRTGALTPGDRDASFAGTAIQGPSLDVALGDGVAWVGSPADARARRFDLSAGSSVAPDDEQALIVAENDADELGAALAIVPDLNGDGLDELAVGAPRRDASDRSSDDGSVYLFLGAGEPDAALSARIDASSADLRLSPQDESDLSATASGRLGEVLAGCPDLEGDGLGDLVAAAPWDSRDATLSGRVFVGLSSALSGAQGAISAESAGLVLRSGVVGARLGASLSCDGDLLDPGFDGPDGLADLVIGAPFADSDEHEAAGAVYLLAAPQSGALPDVASLRLEGPSANAWLGWSVAMGDLSGDGLPELAAGAPGVIAEEVGDTAARGAVLVWDGADLLEDGARAPGRTIIGEQSGDGFGRGLAIGDVDGDGLADLVAGAPLRTPLEVEDAYEAGLVSVFLGETGLAGWRDSFSASTADATIAGGTPYLRLGARIRLGDLDADGVQDLALIGRYDPRDGLPE